MSCFKTEYHTSLTSTVELLLLQIQEYPKEVAVISKYAIFHKHYYM